MLSFLRRWSAVWVAVFLVLVVLYAPARLVGWLIPQSVSLEGLGGTLWRGHAARAAIAVDGNVLMLGELNWRLRPLSLLQLRPAVDLSSVWGQQSLTTRLATTPGGTILLKDLEAVVDVGWVRNLVPLFVEGRVRANFSEITLSDDVVESANGRVVWESAAWAARAGSLPLGTYVLDLEGNDGAINGKLLTLNGGLAVAGDISLTGRDYSIAVTLDGPAMEDEGLQQATALFAIPDGNAYSVDLRGRL
ncbi:MAG: type II secretion system protein N [Halieaceae bacterium]|jgi:hypothetical protein|nr:type II secretion system protein N [Halieaceae bacterium]